MSPRPRLVDLDLTKLKPTVSYLRQVSSVLGSLQRAYLPKEPHLWHYGLQVTLRGLSTQSFRLNGKPTVASLDLVRHKLRLGDESWPLKDYPPAELFNEVKRWLVAQGQKVELEEPHLASGRTEYDYNQSDAYAQVLWWMEAQFRRLSKELNSGLTAPILLYPHHFDLSLVWFPFNDDRQIAIGWSTGDETIPEPYIYLTAYPQSEAFNKLPLPREAYWQNQGFSGAVLPLKALSTSSNATKLFTDFAFARFKPDVFSN